MSARRLPALAVAALAAILAITAGWWALALWPVGRDGPAWVTVTRAVCFGAARDELPNAGGWVLLVGQPLGMLGILLTAWGRELRAGLRALLSRLSGQLATGVVAAAMVAGLSGVVARVAGADAERFVPDVDAAITAALTRIDNDAPAMALVNQRGETVTLEAFRGRPVLVTFAFAHCGTICPLVVSDVTTAASILVDDAPVVLILTLDPWRDTPSRLPTIARAWRLGGGAHVLSHPDTTIVERTLNAWRIPRVRNERTGDVSHPSLVYVLDRQGRIAYAVPGGVETIVAAVRGL